MDDSIKISRDERQEICLQNWFKNKGKGIIICPTGFGKTRVATNMIGRLLNKYPLTKFIIIVPTTVLKDQWTEILDKLGYGLNCDVIVINTAIKNNYKCDVLIIDEAHRVPALSFKAVFNTIQYKYIMCLTATLERLDGLESVVLEHCPVVDKVTLLEAEINGWISPYKEYQVMIEVPDIKKYKEMNKKFIYYFGYFNFDFNLAMKCFGKGGFMFRKKLAEKLIVEQRTELRKKLVSEKLKEITAYAMAFMKTVQERKTFINNHPKKIEIAKKIINARKGKKIITFSNNIKMASKIGIGKVYSGRDTKKHGKQVMEDFKENKFKILNTIRKADEGADIPELSVAIILGLDSSSIKSVQRRGRCIRFEEGKQAEIFNIVINQTVETKWFEKSHSEGNIILIDEEGLNDVLEGKDPRPFNKPLKKIQFRF